MTGGRPGRVRLHRLIRPDFDYQAARELLGHHDVDLDDGRPVPSIGEILDSAWMDRAACRGANPTIFYTDTPGRDTTGRARQICAGCPVRAECLVWAVQCDEQHGIWAGLDEDERRRLVRQLHTERIPHIDHGTNAGFQTHTRLGVPPCARCRDAHARYLQFTRPSRARATQ